MAAYVSAVVPFLVSELPVGPVPGQTTIAVVAGHPSHPLRVDRTDFRFFKTIRVYLLASFHFPVIVVTLHVDYGNVSDFASNQNEK